MRTTSSTAWWRRSPPQPRNCRGDLLHHAVDEVVLIEVAGHVLERQHCNRRFVGERQCLGGGWRCFLGGNSRVPNPVHTHWPGNVLDLLLAHVFEGVIELVSDVIAHHSAD